MMNEVTIEELKRTYSIYPEIRYEMKHIDGYIKTTMATLVRIKRDDKWYVVPCHTEYISQKPVGEVEYSEICFLFMGEGVNLLGRFTNQIHMIQNLYIVTEESAVLDDDQSEESDRIVEKDPVLKASREYDKDRPRT